MCGQSQEGASREEVERGERGLEDLDRRWRDEDGCLNKGGLWGGDGKGGDEDDELAAEQRLSLDFGAPVESSKAVR